MAATKGDLARSTGIEIRSLAVAAAKTITAGDGVEADASGNVQPGTTTGDVNKGLYIAVESVDNSAGSAGDKTVRVASGNTYVYAEAGATIVVGHSVKLADDATCVPSASAPDTKTLGRYVCHENEDVTPTDAVDGDVIVVRLGL